MTRYMTLGLSMLAGAALIEVALVPGLLIGGAAVLAPAYLPKLGRRLRPLLKTAIRERAEPAAPRPAEPSATAPPPPLPALGVKQAIAKTITFRIIVTTLDFTSNYVVIGELATAAGLSTLNLIGGPLLYFFHETGWNYFGPPGAAVDVQALLQDAKAPGGFTISRALAKTITFRTIATVVDFTTNYVVVGNAVTAAGLSAFGFFIGPFVYLGHERLWDHYGSPKERAVEPAAPKLLPAPA